MSEATGGEAGDPRALALHGVVRTFHQGNETLNVLRGVDLNVKRGEMVALVGDSGSGKSTLLQIAGLLERPNEGQVIIAGQDSGRLGDNARSAIRRESVGFVYQYHHLLPEFSALENIILPQMIAGLAKRKAKARALELLDALGLSERASHRPAKLSGGEQQRVAIARAVANGPSLLLADEPTGNLDQTTAGRVFSQLQSLVSGAGFGALVATHNLDLARSMNRTLVLKDGVVEER